MRLGIILSSQIINHDLVADFGEIVPIDLPLANKPILNYQLDSLKKYSDEILITLPESYKSNWVDNNIHYCKRNITLYEVIKDVFEKHKNFDNYLFYFGDTLLNYEIDNDVMYTGDPTYKYPSWFYISKNEVFSGIFSISNPNLTYSIKKSKNTNDFLQCLNSKLNKVRAKEWYDFGNYSSYYNSKKRFLETRVFNSVSVSKNSILTKSSNDIPKMYYEYNWLFHFSNIFPANVPSPKNFKMYKNSASYDMEYMPLPTLAEIYVFGKNDSIFWNNVIQRCATLLNKIQKSNISKKNDERFYSKKCSERIIMMNSISFKISKKFFDQQKLLSSALDKYDDKVVPSHGDFCFSNMLFNIRNNTIKLIDPRGFMNRDHGQSFLMPKSYDLFKLTHSIVAGYDKIIATSQLPEIDYRFLKLISSTFKIEEKWLYAGLSHLFFTMIPLHDDNVSRQQCFYKISNIFYADYTNSRKRK